MYETWREEGFEKCSSSAHKASGCVRLALGGLPQETGIDEWSGPAPIRPTPNMSLEVNRYLHNSPCLVVIVVTSVAILLGASGCDRANIDERVPQQPQPEMQPPRKQTRKPPDLSTIASMRKALKSPDPAIRKEAVRALGQTKDRRVLNQLLFALKDPNLGVRNSAAWALGEIPDRRALKPLIAAFENPDYYVGSINPFYVCRALGTIKDAHSIPFLIRCLKQGGQRGDKAEAAWALEQIGKPAVAPLIGVLKEKSWPTAMYAARSLGTIGDRRAVQPLIETMLSRRSGQSVVAQATRSLGRLKDTRAIVPLLQAARDQGWLYRSVAAEALAAIGKQAVPTLIAALADQDRQTAAKALGLLRDPRSIGPLVAALQDAFSDNQYEVALALGMIGRPATQRLVELMTTDPSKRRLVAVAFTASNDPEAMDLLYDALHSREWDIIDAAYVYFILQGESGTEGILAESLDHTMEIYGSGKAEVCLNSGNRVLERAARRWSRRHRYFVAQRGEGMPQWGGRARQAK